MPFNAKMRKARERKKLTQKELGFRSGIGSASICAYENLRAWPDGNKARAICDVLGRTDVDEIFPIWMSEFLKPRKTDFNIYINVDRVALEAPELLELPDSIEVNKKTMEESVEKNVDNNLLRKDLSKVMETLNDRERKILELRFGLVDNNPHTLEQVGRKFGVNRERIRQVEAKALRKLRHPSRANSIRKHIADD